MSNPRGTKFAIISSQNTTRTLNFAERKKPVRSIQYGGVNSKKKRQFRDTCKRREETSQKGSTMSITQSQDYSANASYQSFSSLIERSSPMARSPVQSHRDTPFSNESQDLTTPPSSSYTVHVDMTDLTVHEVAPPSLPISDNSRSPLSIHDFQPDSTKSSLLASSLSESNKTLSPVSHSDDESLLNRPAGLRTQSETALTSGHHDCSVNLKSCSVTGPLGSVSASADTCPLVDVNSMIDQSSMDSADLLNSSAPPLHTPSPLPLVQQHGKQNNLQIKQVDSTSVKGEGDIKDNLSVAEFFAFGTGPISLSDFRIDGEKMFLQTKENHTTSSGAVMEPKNILATSVKPPSFSALPHSVHQFCVQSTLPLLPLQLQILSRKVHAHPPPKEWPVFNKEKQATKDHHTSGDETKEGEGLQVFGVTLPVETDPMKLLWSPAPGKLALYPSTVQRLLTTQRMVSTEMENDVLKEESPETTELDDNHLEQVKQLQSSVSQPDDTVASEMGGDIEELQQGDAAHDVEREEVGETGGEGEQEEEEEKMGEVQERSSVVDSYAKFLIAMNEVQWQREQLIESHKQMAAAVENSQRDEREVDEETISGSQVSQFGSSSTFASTRLMRKAMRGGRRGAVSTTAKAYRSLKRTKSALARSQYLRQEVSKPPRRLKRSISHPFLSHNVNQVLLEDQKDINYNQSQVKMTRNNSVPDIIKFDQLMRSKGKSSDDPYKWAESLWDEWFYEVLAEVRAAVAELERGRRPVLQWEPCCNTQQEKSEVKRSEGKSGTMPAAKSDPLPPEELDLVDIPPLTGVDVEASMARIMELTSEISKSQDPVVKAGLLSERGSLYRGIGQLVDSMSDLSEALSLSPRVSTPHWVKHLLLLAQGKEKLALDELTILLKKDHGHILGFLSKGTLLAKKGDLGNAIQNHTQAVWLDSNNPKLYFIRAELREKKGEVEAAVSDYSTVVKLDPLNEEALLRQAVHKFNRKLWGITAQLLTTLLGINQNKTEAWLLRSQAYLKMGKQDLALQDLSAAIHLNPNNASLYYQRGCLLRSQYPSKAIQDFSVSLLLDSSASNALSLLHRGVAYTQLKCFDEALSDFQSAVQLDGSLSSAHTNAGLIMMNHRMKPRLREELMFCLSTSGFDILFHNIKIRFLGSGVVRLFSPMSLLPLGVVLRSLPQPKHEALKYFTAGISADPTYIRALLCRAEAYTQLGQLKNAILDWTRAIHYSPDNPSYHLNQGKVYLQIKDYSNAMACIQTSSKLGGGVGSSPAQQALVCSFLGDHHQAISRLQSVVKGRKNVDLCTVLGKIQLRAKMFGDAAVSFKDAIDYISIFDLTTSRLHIAIKTELHYLCGRSLLGDGKFRKAAEEFSHVVSASPENSWAHYYHGLSLLKAGTSRGMVSINQALMLKPNLIEGYLTRAAYYGKVGRLSKAILNCSEAIRLQPKSVRAYLYRGVLRHKMGYQQAAIADLSEAITCSPRHSSLALFNRAICYQTTGDTDKALRDYSAVCLNEEVPSYQLMVNRGLLYLSIRDYQNALCDFKHAAQLKSEKSTMWQAIAFCHHQLGQLQEAVQSYTAAIELDPSFTEAYIGRGNVYTEFLTEGGNQKARSDYLCVIERDPSCLPAQLNLSLLLQSEGKHMSAWKKLTALLEVHKDYVPALEARAIISLQNMNTFGSLLDINRAIQLEPSAKLYTERGVIHHYMKDVYNAVKDFERAISMDPNLSMAHYNMGNVLLQQKLYRQAIDRYSRVIELTDRSDEALVNRGICFMAIGDSENALCDFNAAVEINQFAAHGYFNRANLQRTKGNLVEAEKDYCKALMLHPNDPVSLNHHGYSLGLLGYKEEANKQFFNAVMKV